MSSSSKAKTPATTTSTTGFRGMPGRTSKDAPSFSGRAKDLLDFFTQFEDLADSCGLTTAEKCRAVLRYVDSDTRELWASFPEFEASDYDVFKARIIDEYPGADRGAQYTYHDLENVVLRHVDHDISTETEFVEYSHKFRPVATWLVKNKKISERERDKLFWQGLPRLVQREITMQLQLDGPRGFDRTAHPDFEKVIRAGRVVLGNDRFDADSNDLVTLRIQSARNASVPAASNIRTTHLRDYDNTDRYHQADNMRQEVRTKTVRLDATSAEKPSSTEVEDLARRMYDMNINDAVYAGCYMRLVYLNPSAAQFVAAPAKYRTNLPAPIQQTYTTSSTGSPASQPSLTSTSCYMCGGPHFLSQCSVVEDYIRAGRIVRREAHLTFPDGSRLIRHHGTGLFRTTIDERFGSSLPVQSSTPTSMPSTSEFRRDPPPHIASTTYGTAEPDVASFVFQCVPIAENNAVIIEADEDVEVHAITRSKAKEKDASKPPQENTHKKEGGERPNLPKNQEQSKEDSVPSVPDKRTPAYTYKSKAMNPMATKETFSKILEVIVPSITVGDLLAISPDLRKEAVDYTRTHRIPTLTAANELSTAVPPPLIEYSTPLRELKVTLNGIHEELGLLDDGSEIVVIREDIWKASQAKINSQIKTRMQTANGSIQEMPGCVEMLEIDIEGVKTWVHAFVIPDAPYRILLGCPWQRHVRLKKDEDDDDVYITIRDPCNHSNLRRIATTPRPFQGPPNSLAFLTAVRASVSHALQRAGFSASTAQAAPRMQIAAMPFTEEILRAQYTLDHIRHTFAYKKVANRVKPVATTMPQHARIIRRFPEDPLLTLPFLSPHPPEFTEGKRLTTERVTQLGILDNPFLWPEEQKLAAQVLRINELALAWDESEKGRFRDDYFEPVVIPTVEHTPWVHRQPPIPPGIRDDVIKLIKSKIASRVYEPSNSSYQSRWFCVAKKNGSIRIVHDLQPLNAVTIKDAATLPYVEHFAEQSTTRSIYTMMDLFVGYDHRALAEQSRDLTTFQTPLGTFRLTVLPQGWTDSPAVFQNDVAFVLQCEIDIAPNFQDDINVLGPHTRYELPDGTYETISVNSGIRRFVWEHCNDVNRILHRLGHAGATVSAKKLFMCRPEVIVVGQTCNYEGRIPDKSKVSKIRNWPPCETKTEVRGFLGTAGTVRIWIKDFSAISRPLVHLTKKDVSFEWGEKEQHAMDTLKSAVVSSPAIRPLDYLSSNEVILAVDSSHIAVGYILSQVNNDGKRCPARFGSIMWNDRESRYSQAKLELYGLFRALKSVKVWIIGVKDFTIEVDAQYIKGMINNPDIQPNASMNRWLTGIQTFDFKLRHVSATKHQGPDGLSRRRRGEGDREEEDSEEEADEWIDEVLGCGVWIAGGIEEDIGKGKSEVSTFLIGKGREDDTAILDFNPPTNDDTRRRDEDLQHVSSYLRTLKLPASASEKERARLIRYSKQFFLSGNQLWRRDRSGRHQKVLFGADRTHILRETHDKLGHRGFYPTRRTISDRFWWPSLDKDLTWYLKTCHQCQIWSVGKVVIPPVVTIPAPLFRKAHIDTMHMPKSHGFSYIVQARCSLSAWPEFRMLRTETAQTLGAFIFEEILCRWGGLEEIVMDNGTPFVTALDWLAEKYHIRHIRISAYNSQANGVVERSHRTIRDSLVKACNGDITQWPSLAHHVFWADRVTTRKSTGYSPYYMAHGVEPLLPFDISEATFMSPEVSRRLETHELIAIRARQLAK